MISLILFCCTTAAAATNFDGIVRNQSDGTQAAYLSPPYLSNHASTVEILPDGTLAVAWFSGDKEEANRCAIVFATLPSNSNQWTNATTLSVQNGFSNQNPVLFYDKSTKLLRLYHSHAPANSGESKSIILQLSSSDYGKTWTLPAPFQGGTFDGAFPRNRIIPSLNHGFIFPIYNAKTNLPVFDVSPPNDLEGNWTQYELPASAGGAGLVQPTVVRSSSNPTQLRVWFRDRAAQHIYTATSTDEARTWTRPIPSGLPNPNVGIEANNVMFTTSEDEMKHGIVMVFNDYNEKNQSKWGRTPLNIALSLDDGVTWPYMRTLQVMDDDVKRLEKKVEYSYPSVLQTLSDGHVHVTYTYDRDCIKYRRVTVGWIMGLQGMEEEFL